MSEPLVSRCADAAAVADRSARVLATAIDAALAIRGEAHVALSGGSTVARIYDRLGPLVPEWRGVHLWYGDERVVGLDDEESTHRLATEHLDAPGATWHPLAVERGPDGAAEAYAAELDGVVLDVALNGMGPDGHTASLFPGRPEVAAQGVCVAVHDAPKPPPERVSLTLGTLNAARRILLVVTGAEKAGMLARVIAGPEEDVPASLLARDRLEVVADEEALHG